MRLFLLSSQKIKDFFIFRKEKRIYESNFLDFSLYLYSLFLKKTPNLLQYVLLSRCQIKKRKGSH